MLHRKNKAKDLIKLTESIEIFRNSQAHGSLTEDEINDIVYQLRELADVKMI